MSLTNHSFVQVPPHTLLLAMVTTTGEVRKILPIPFIYVKNHITNMLFLFTSLLGWILRSRHLCQQLHLPHERSFPQGGRKHPPPRGQQLLVRLHLIRPRLRGRLGRHGPGGGQRLPERRRRGRDRLVCRPDVLHPVHRRRRRLLHLPGP